MHGSVRELTFVTVTTRGGGFGRLPFSLCGRAVAGIPAVRSGTPAIAACIAGAVEYDAPPTALRRRGRPQATSWRESMYDPEKARVTDLLQRLDTLRGRL